METVEITLHHYYTTNSIGCEQESGLRLNFAYWSTRRLTDTHHLTFRICACLFHTCRPPLCRSWRPRRPSYQTTTRQPCILRRRSYSVEQLAVRHSNCFFCDNFQESTQDSFIYPVILHNIISSVRCCTAPL